MRFIFPLHYFYIFDFVKLSHIVKIVDTKDPSLKQARCSFGLQFVLCQESLVRLFPKTAPLKYCNWWLKSSWTWNTWELVSFNHTEHQKEMSETSGCSSIFRISSAASLLKQRFWTDGITLKLMFVNTGFLVFLLPWDDALIFFYIHAYKQYKHTPAFSPYIWQFY